MTRIGVIGVGLMGHGIARNVLLKGYPLTVLEHPGNQPLDELLAGGCQTRKSGAEVARESDVLILCVTGAPEVEAVLTAPGGVLEGLRPGAIVVDCSTSVPEATEAMAKRVAQAGGRFIDAPMTRTAKHAHEGKLNLLVGGPAETLAEVRPVLACFAENITHAGVLGAGHRMKLLHNYVSLGFIALLAEASACARRSDVSLDVFVEVLASGGGKSAALERLAPYLLNGDSSGLQFSIANAAKDLGYYTQMAGHTGAAQEIADAVLKTLAFGVETGGKTAMVPELASML
ncbi:NAD(P)-dependent oxidoreductase [Bosea sp. TWI1241]|uniref:NAD(P)-dependent oxidoreductase n=1 Tax=Bosea sp. TWI1241 TaxID=3148904 RepID=UPI003209DB75